MTLKTPHGTYQNDWHFGFYKDMPLADAKVQLASARGEAASSPPVKKGTSILLSADRPTFFVWANCRGVRGEFDDNCFTLLPGRPKTLRFSGSLEPKALTVTHLADLVRRKGESGFGN